MLSQQRLRHTSSTILAEVTDRSKGQQFYTMQTMKAHPSNSSHTKRKKTPADFKKFRDSGEDLPDDKEANIFNAEEISDINSGQ